MWLWLVLCLLELQARLRLCDLMKLELLRRSIAVAFVPVSALAPVLDAGTT